MIFRPFKAEHLYAVEVQPSQAKALSFMRWPIAKAAQEAGDGWTGYADDGRIIGCAGFVPHGAALLAWAVFSPLTQGLARSVMRKVRDELEARPKVWIEAHIENGDGKAASFAKRLGFVFQREAEERHPSGASYAIYVRR